MTNRGFVVVRHVPGVPGLKLPQGMDESSGGYPFDAPHIRLVYLWPLNQEAEVARYTNIINGNNPEGGAYGKFTYMKATITLTLE